MELSPGMGTPWGQVSLEWIRSAQNQFALDRSWTQFHTPRNLALALMGEVGELCECFQWKTALDCDRLQGFTSEEKVHVGEEVSDVMFYLVRLSDMCGIDLARAARAKIRLNAKKYPASLVRDSAEKYDAYGAQTGFTKVSKQVTVDENAERTFVGLHPGQPWSHLLLQDLREELLVFTTERGWNKFHMPRSLALALSGEAGELCEVLQYKSEEACAAGLPGLDVTTKDKLAQEVSDVLIYLVRLADVCGLQLDQALEAKLQKNAVKYPVALSKNSNKKYKELHSG
ncbi:unnamed protein product, partial [Discosporangium mesarthrocarpum]